MTLKQLHFFVMVAKRGNVSRAAEELKVAQPFLSKVISALEDELEVKLFNRFKNKMALNPCGQSLLKHIERINLEIDNAKSELKDIAGQADNRMVLATNVSLYVIDLLRSFYDKYPHISIHQTAAGYHDMLRMLESGQIDFAVAGPHSPPARNIFSFQQVLTEKLVVIYPSGHRFGRARPASSMSISELRDELLITALPGFGIRDASDILFKQAQMTPNYIVESSDTSAIRNYVRAGFGVGLQPYTIVKKDPELLRSSKLLRSAKNQFAIFLISLQEKYMNRTKTAFANHVKKFFAVLEQETFQN